MIGDIIKETPVDFHYKSYEQGYLDGRKRALSTQYVGKRFFRNGALIGFVIGALTVALAFWGLL